MLSEEEIAYLIPCIDRIVETEKGICRPWAAIYLRKRPEDIDDLVENGVLTLATDRHGVEYICAQTLREYRVVQDKLRA